MCCGAVCVVSVLLFVFARPLFGVFSAEAATVDAGVVYLRIQTLVSVFMALESIYEGAFVGSRNTMPPLWIGAIGTFARLPLAWGLAWPMGMGVVGIWWAIALSTAVKGIVMWVAFERTLGREARGPSGT